MKKLLLLLAFLFLVGCTNSETPKNDDPKFEPKMYTITFQTNETTTYDPITKQETTVVNLPSMEKDGYTFVGWVDQDGTTYTSQITVTKNVTLIPRWSLATYEVTFVDANDQVISVVQVFYKQFVTAPTAPELENHVFFEWDKPLTQITENTTIKAIYLKATDGLVYDRIDDGYQIADYTGSALDVVIPAYYKGQEVTEIGTRAFEASLITTISFPDTLKHIGDYAFYGSKSLSSLSFPSGLLSLGDHSFAECVSITTLTIPAKEIKERAFYSLPRLTDVVLLDSVEIIGPGAFFQCGSLVNLTIPTSVSVIGDHFVSWCQKLANIYTDESNVERLKSMVENVVLIYSKIYTIQTKK